MTQRDNGFWLGLLLYAASFFLVAVVSGLDSAETERGYTCAGISLEFGWVFAKSLLHPSAPVLIRLFPIVVAGLINPVFLLFTIRPNKILRACLLSMIPFSWVVFYFWDGRLYPREGHFLWLAGMLLVLFSCRKSSRQVLVGR